MGFPRALLLMTAALAYLPPVVMAQSTSDLGTFAFSNLAGTHVLAAPNSWGSPETARMAICEGGQTAPVLFEDRQASTADDDGRQLAYNFEFQPGDRFRIVGAPVRSDATCFVATNRLLALGEIVMYSVGTYDECGSAVHDSIHVSRSRAVVRCWLIGRIGAHRSVYAVEFERIGNDALAALILVRAGQMAFMDLPGDYDDPYSVWRVDDAGEFDPRTFKVLFAVIGPAVDILGISWAGAEGASLQLLLSRAGASFERVVDGYRYWVPK